MKKLIKTCKWCLCILEGKLSSDNMLVHSLKTGFFRPIHATYLTHRDMLFTWEVPSLPQYFITVASFKVGSIPVSSVKSGQKSRKSFNTISMCVLNLSSTNAVCGVEDHIQLLASGLCVFSASSGATLASECACLCVCVSVCVLLCVCIHFLLSACVTALVINVSQWPL